MSCFVLYYYNASHVDIKVHTSRPKLKRPLLKLNVKEAVIKEIKHVIEVIYSEV